MDSKDEFLLELIHTAQKSADDKLTIISDGVAGINLRLDALNGRLRKNEVAVGRLKLVIGGVTSTVGIVFAAILAYLLK